MTYHPTSLVSYNATLFLEAALKNEDQCPNWLLAALKSCESPALEDGVIVTSQMLDWIDDEDDDGLPPSYVREDYNHILPKKRETSRTHIRPSGPMMTHFVDADRKFRLDIRFWPVLYMKNGSVTSIDVLDVEIMNSTLTPASEEFMLEWFQDRIEQLNAYRNTTSKAPHLKLVVVNE